MNNQTQKNYEYKMNHFYRDFSAGCFRGGMLGFCYGIIMGAYVNYNEEIKMRELFRKCRRFTALSTLSFMPVLGVSSVVYKFMNAKDYGDAASMIVTVAATGCMFELAKRIVH
jgi:hypothetical protein